MPNIIFNMPLYFTGITTYIYTELAPKLTATTSVERWYRGRGFNSQPETLKLHFPQLSLKMSIFLTLEFTTTYFNFHLLTTSVNSKY